MLKITRTPGREINKGIQGSGMQFDFDPTDFLMGLDYADKLVQGAVKKGLKQAGIQLSKDVIDGLPLIPEDSKSLASSGSVFVENKHVYTVPNIYTGETIWHFGAPKPPTPATESTDVEGGQPFTAMVVFNKPYAARWHELLPSSGAFSRPGANIKWMSSKLIMNMGKYVDIIRSTIQTTLEKQAKRAQART